VRVIASPAPAAWPLRALSRKPPSGRHRTRVGARAAPVPCPAIALYSTQAVHAAARALVRRRRDQGRAPVGLAGRRVHPRPQIRSARPTAVRAVPARPVGVLAPQRRPARHGATPRRSLRQLRRFGPPVRVIFSARDHYLNPGSSAISLRCSPTASGICSTAPGTTSKSTNRSRWPISSSANREQQVTATVTPRRFPAAGLAGRTELHRAHARQRLILGMRILQRQSAR
jgi:hypothetical protein